MTRNDQSPIVIFGAGQIADVARAYLEQAGRTISAFTVDDDFRQAEEHDGLPLHAWSTLESVAPPATVELFCPMSYRKVNRIRMDKYYEGKARGYRFASFVHPDCINNAASIGENCFILEQNVLQPFTTIGDNVILWSGNHIGHHSRIADHCFLASHVVVSGAVSIGARCFVGVNATIGDNVTIGEAAVIGAGALVLANVPAEGVVARKSDELLSVPSSRLRSI